MYDDILIPMDSNGSDQSEVIEQGLFLAELCGATIHALHVVDDRAYSSIPEDVRERVRDTLQEDGEDATKTVAERAVDADVTVVREVRWGDPTVGILSYARENDVDLIVMGTHGRTGYERYLLGSVTEKVVRAAPIPVLTLQLGDGEPEDALAALDAETIE